MYKKITPKIISAFVECPRKALLLFADDQGIPNEYVKLLEEDTENNRKNYITAIKDKISFDASEAYNTDHEMSFVFETILETEEFQAPVDILTLVKSSTSIEKQNYLPSLVTGTHKTNKQQKLQLAFIGHVLSICQNGKPVSGTIIAMSGKSHKIKLEPLYNEVESILEVIKKWRISSKLEPPSVVLNKHCSCCLFQKQCEILAIESDHLSLLGGIGKREIDKFNKKGIFTVTQLSYTFRSRKRTKRGNGYIKPHSFPLQALAIRDQKVYVHETPTLPKSRVEIFFDIEGIPDRGLQYLIGLFIKENTKVNHHYFWANSSNEELIIFQNFLHILDQYDDYILFHYGNYETTYLKRMSKKLNEHQQEKVGKALRSSCNILAFLYSNIYFPTYTNGLKDIARAIDFVWSDPHSSGLQSIVWRRKWESSQCDDWKNKLILYNKEDCLALSKVKNLIEIITENEAYENALDLSHEVVYQERVKTTSQLSFMYKNYSLPAMKMINECSYFDYQKLRVHARCEKAVKRCDRKKLKCQKIRSRVNKVVEINATVCTKCGSSDIRKMNALTRKVTDLKFFNGGAKKWITKYCSAQYSCRECHHTHTPEAYLNNARQCYGHNLKCWTIFQHIVNKESFRQIESNCLELFKIKLPSSSSHQFKKYFAKYYEYTSVKLLNKILNSHVIYVDETPFNLLSETVYAWVFTNGSEVVSLYKSTREGGFLKDLFQEVNGVVVSDYYSAYDSINCPQQKCLIHLIRDFNSDLLKNPFDNELKSMTQEFTSLLQNIVETVDKYGLKKRHLNKHNKEARAFFKNILNREYHSEIAQQYQQRLKKNKDKLFTFLNFDNVGWNNTNAEHAIKVLATHRNMNIKFYRSSRIEDYLKIMSIYQTCEYKGISFLQFMLSREVDFDVFLTN